jgi:hypothetical protein
LWQGTVEGVQVQNNDSGDEAVFTYEDWNNDSSMQDGYTLMSTIPEVDPVTQEQGFWVDSSSETPTSILTLCGQKQGQSFYTVTRPNSDNQCPDGHSVCSTNTSVDNTWCYPDDSEGECPITGIQWGYQGDLWTAVPGTT